MKKENYARKGFTLVELLIVIVVIGILSAMMMLSSTEAMSSAKASNISSNLRNFKTAILAWYADHIDYILPDGTVKNNVDDTTGVVISTYIDGSDSSSGNHRDAVLKYFNNENVNFKGTPDKGGYGLSANTNGDWYVCYNFTDAEASVIEKLQGRAKTLGLIFTTGTTAPAANTTSPGVTDKTAKVVWLKVVGSGKTATTNS